MAPVDVRRLVFGRAGPPGCGRRGAGPFVSHFAGEQAAAALRDRRHPLRQPGRGDRRSAATSSSPRWRWRPPACPSPRCGSPSGPSPRWRPSRRWATRWCSSRRSARGDGCCRRSTTATRPRRCSSTRRSWAATTLDLLHPGVHRQAGPRHPQLRGRRRVHRGHLPARSTHWITNTARGGRRLDLPGHGRDRRALAGAPPAAVGGGVVAIDLLESPDGPAGQRGQLHHGVPQQHRGRPASTSRARSSAYARRHGPGGGPV